tara:strand:+ start:764 stop:955 length:192 start_codon:yes stop_codon:yes gene_type:complete
MPKYLVNATIYGQFEKVLDCPNGADALLEANEMAHLYTVMVTDSMTTSVEYDVQELHEGDEDF